MKNSLELVIEQVRLEGGFKRGGRIRAADCLRQIVSNRWASVPAHCGLSGNEKADELIKPAAKERQQDNSVTFQEKKTLIREALGQRAERDDFHFLDRCQQVVVMRLHTDHN